MRVRWAGESDAETIARLHVASWQATYRNELPAEFLATQDPAARTAYWQGEIARDVDVLVVEKDQELVGFVACGPTRDAVDHAETVFEIYNLHVAPGRHGQGIGGALFEAALAEASMAGAAELSLWVVETNANARGFYEHQGMQADGASQVHRVGPGVELREVRYRLSVIEGGEVRGAWRHGPGGPAGDENWKLLEPIEKAEPESRGMRLALTVGFLILVALFGSWFFPGLRERAARIESRRQFESADSERARRAAEREVQAFLRPVEHGGNVGGDASVRRWRLGLAYGRLALIEERAGDSVKRDRYFELSRRALRDAGAKDPTDDFIRACVLAGQCR